ncbi:MAG TPA: hypothetical protein VG797_02460 [Phycisphaerales bacterium]|nr:hypothetical protein [Phycisphaerales bacterium]
MAPSNGSGSDKGGGGSGNKSGGGKGGGDGNNWPSKTSNPSGPDRDNNPPKK